jgi:hypothetical protein
MPDDHIDFPEVTTAEREAELKTQEAERLRRAKEDRPNEHLSASIPVLLFTFNHRLIGATKPTVDGASEPTVKTLVAESQGRDDRGR